MSVMNCSFENVRQKQDVVWQAYALVTIKQWMSIVRYLVVAHTSTQYTRLIFSHYHAVCH
jgi:hypothetical protein